MIFQTSSIGFKSKESPGHSKTGVLLISRIRFADLELLQRSLPCIYTCTNSFHILDWSGSFSDLNPVEEVWNIMKRRCESLPNNKFAHYGIIRMVGGTNRETVG